MAVAATGRPQIELAKPTELMAPSGTATSEPDAYHEVETLWRQVRDYETLCKLSSQENQASWSAEIVIDPSSDPRCERLPGSTEAYALRCTAAGDGVFLCPGVLGRVHQRALLRSLICDWANPPNRSNIWPATATENELRSGLADFLAGQTDTVVEKLRWVTVGQQYDWTARRYLDEGSEAASLPTALRELSDFVTSCLPLPAGAEARPFTAAICNFYHAARRPSDRLGGHRDDVEADVASPLVSVSVGLPCVFLLGGVSRRERPTPILLRSGSVLVLAGGSRQAYHGVPTVLVPPRLQPAGPGKRPRPLAVPVAYPEVYRPWEVAGCNAVGAMERDMEVEDEPPDLAAALDRLMFGTRLNFSIRAVGG
eukprot:gnl/TRDRNA2_/TRDRNA2_169305_c1_seq1.p1 gnl/TRDRNA2_/TRDRNA2_169305_c1~~gnl/TRDRNA2_/TRDRNA2_169305_c1_seq1.p1  ORF type:complete len:369 (+),score=41.83 gnl/TRDRNA2_/TRDRNA2_169305_c1_seq1:48-1154(+)